MYEVTNDMSTGHNKGYNKGYNKLGQSFIEDKDIQVYVEQIPRGLNFIDMIRFKQLTTSGINGCILKVFNLKEYIIYLYTKQNIDKNKRILLTYKLDFLQKIVKDSTNCELWVIKDLNYLCIGLFKGVPVFIKSFESTYDVNENLEMMVGNMNEYLKLENMRFFCCNSKDFTKINYNVYEYSEVFMSDIMDGYDSINEYCKQIQLSKISRNKLDLFTIYGSGMALILAFVCYVAEKKFSNMTNLLCDKTALIMQNKNIPSRGHFDAMQRIEKEYAFRLEQ